MLIQVTYTFVYCVEKFRKNTMNFFNELVDISDNCSVLYVIIFDTEWLAAICHARHQLLLLLSYMPALLEFLQSFLLCYPTYNFFLSSIDSVHILLYILDFIVLFENFFL